jgi:hypothetical protein
LTSKVSNDSIAIVIGLPQNDEKWFKEKMDRRRGLTQFLCPSKKNPNWAKEVCQSWVMESWRDIIFCHPEVCHM